MADIVELVCESLLSSTNLSPSFPIIFAAVKIQRQCERDCHAIIDIERVEFSIDIEVEKNFLAAFAERLDAGDSVVLCAVDIGDLEAVLEEDIFGHLDGK